MRSEMRHVTMCRSTREVPWGFSFQGGSEFGLPLVINQVYPSSLADTSQVKEGDCIVEINDSAVDGVSHQQALDAVLRGGDRLSITLTRSEHPSSTFVDKKAAEDTKPDLNSNIGPAGIVYHAKLVYSDVTTPNSSDPVESSNPTPLPSDMSYNQMRSPQEAVPDQLLNQFVSKRPEDKPFSYLPTGGMAELQQRQRSVPPPVKPKPVPQRQTSHNPSSASSSADQYNSQSLFTPAYQEYVKQQQEQVLNSQPGMPLPADNVGMRPDQVPPEAVAAYILQPDGSMVALRPNSQHSSWDDKASPNLQNSAVMTALMEEQDAQLHGQTSGRIQPTGPSKQGLSFKVLQWLTGTDSEDNSETTSNYSGSHDGMIYNSPAARRLRQQSLESPIREESPVSSDGRGKRHRIKVINRSESRDNSNIPSSVVAENTAFCDL